ncbi:ABC transporter substrate-binding protein [Glaciibacter superstes]|uniref:ABC transporter substrate-binding protein n=1 Tax=Glaciibacter superstes TaxID=501023 RepID=UPI0003B4E87A|nr:extracellular solute-binding protein [Glaciibacter superstes]
MRITTRWMTFGGMLAAGSLLVTGCAGASDGQSQEETATEITALILSSAAYDPCAEEYAAAFEDETGIHVDVISEGFPTYHDKLLTTLSSGTDAYDVAMLAYQWTGEFAAPGFIVPLDDAVAAKSEGLNGIIQSASELYTFEGEQWGIPFSAQAETLFYRTDLFEAAGFEPPKTWDDFAEIVDFFTNNPDYPGVFGTSTKAATQHSATDFANRYYGLGGGQIGAADLDGDLVVEALELLKASVDASPSGALSATFVETGAQMQAGTVAMIEAMPSTVLNLLKDELPENQVYGNIGLAALPGGGGEAGGWGWVVPTTSKKQQAAIDFASFMSSEEADLGCYVEFGKSAVQEATYDVPEVAEAFYTAGIAAAVASAKGKPNSESASKINNMLDESVARFLAGQAGSSQDAADDIVQQYDALVEG